MYSPGSSLNTFKMESLIDKIKIEKKHEWRDIN